MKTRLTNAGQSPARKRQDHIPGLKVAYGEQGVSTQKHQSYQAYPQGHFFQMAPPPSEAKNKGPLSRLMESIINLVTEEAIPDRPIGISQLSRNTFRASGGDGSGRGFVRSETRMQDYRFNQLIDRP